MCGNQIRNNIPNGNTDANGNQTSATVITSNSNFNPIVREVREIYKLQRKAVNNTCISCSGSALGDNVASNTAYNTRPFILYLPNGEEFRIRIADFFNGTSINTANEVNSTNTNSNPNRLGPTTSNIFRVEEVMGESAKLRALKVVCGKYYATRYCCTIDLTGVLCIQCLSDTYVSNLANSD